MLTLSSLLFRKHNFPGVTILLSLTIFLNMVSAMMPVTDNNPLLGKIAILLRRSKSENLKTGINSSTIQFIFHYLNQRKNFLAFAKEIKLLSEKFVKT